MNAADSKPSRVKQVLHGPFGIVIFGWGLAVPVFAIIIVLIALTLRDFGEWSFDEVTRVTNLNANVDGVLVETNGGATTSFAYEVFVLPRGQKPKRSDQPVVSLYGAGRSVHAYGANLRWTSNDTLVVEYLDAQHADWINGSLGVNGRLVNIVMKSGINDPSAPPGGMLYNLEPHR
jgi:hypothetical protein